MNIIHKSLLNRFLSDNPFQPATSLWRAFEIAFMVNIGLPSGRGLDLGCGDGKLTRIILELTGPRQLVGIDPDPLETSMATSEALYESVHTVGGSEIPQNSESFDFILSNSVLEHIPDLEPVLLESARLLKGGGTFVASVPGPDFHACLRGPWFSQAKRAEYLAALDKRVAHVRYPSAEDWKGMFERNGLELVEAKPYLSKQVVRRWELVSRLSAGALVALTMGRKRPIEIQRSLGIRGKKLKLPGFVISLFASFLGLGLRDQVRPGEMSGCLLVVAKKPDQK